MKAFDFLVRQDPPLTIAPTIKTIGASYEDSFVGGQGLTDIVRGGRAGKRIRKKIFVVGKTADPRDNLLDRLVSHFRRAGHWHQILCLQRSRAAVMEHCLSIADIIQAWRVSTSDPFACAGGNRYVASRIALI